MTHRVKKEESSEYFAIVREVPKVGGTLKNFVIWDCKNFGLKCCRTTSEIVEVEFIGKYTYKVVCSDQNIYFVQIT